MNCCLATVTLSLWDRAYCLRCHGNRLMYGLINPGSRCRISTVNKWPYIYSLIYVCLFCVLSFTNGIIWHLALSFFQDISFDIYFLCIFCFQDKKRSRIYFRLVYFAVLYIHQGTIKSDTTLQRAVIQGAVSDSLRVTIQAGRWYTLGCFTALDQQRNCCFACV